MNSRSEWFAALAALAYPADRNRAQAAFQPYLPWFNDMPNAAFTRASLEAVVTAPRKMAIPSYDEIRKPLAAWWRDNRPADVRLQSEYPALPSPETRGEPTPEEVAAVAEKVRALKAEFAAIQAAKPPSQQFRSQPKPLTDAQLLAEYERIAGDGRQPSGYRDLAATRVRLLRERLGLDEPQPAPAPEPTPEPAVPEPTEVPHAIAAE